MGQCSTLEVQCLPVIHHGFGKSIWDIVPTDDIPDMYNVCHFPNLFLSMDRVDNIAVLLHFCLVYKVQISLVKISVCLFLLQIFEWTAFCYISYTVIALNAAIEITWMFLDSFQCIPVHLAMDWMGKWGAGEIYWLFWRPLLLTTLSISVLIWWLSFLLSKSWNCNCPRWESWGRCPITLFE